MSIVTSLSNVTHIRFKRKLFVKYFDDFERFRQIAERYTAIYVYRLHRATSIEANKYKNGKKNNNKINHLRQIKSFTVLIGGEV